MVEALLDLPAVRERLVLPGQLQRAGHQRLTELGQEAWTTVCSGNPHAHRRLLRVQQPARHLAGCRQDERVAAGRARLHRPERGLVDLHELAQLREVAADEGEVVAGLQVADLADAVQRPGVAE